MLIIFQFRDFQVFQSADDSLYYWQGLGIRKWWDSPKGYRFDYEAADAALETLLEAEATEDLQTES